MGFSIGGLLGGIGALASGVSSIFGLGGAKAPKVRTVAAPRALPAPAPTQVSPLFQQAVFRPGAVPSIGMGGVQVAGAVPAVIRGVTTLTAGLLARAGAAVGKRVSHRSVLALVKQVGLIAAASALALSVEEIAQLVATVPRRRRRGITARDISTTKRVIRRVHGIQHDLSHLAGPIRRRAARHHHHRSA